MNTRTRFSLVLALCAACTAFAAQYSWQEQPATVLHTGDLEWNPQPFTFSPGESIRYIDFEDGDDANDGTAVTNAWKHHPWDPAATGKAKAASGVDTYVFKRGVIYRGEMEVPERTAGTAENPVQLTSDPDWGEGEAAIYGSEIVSGWEQGGHERMPEVDRVWHADLDYAPRAVWMVDATGAITRLKLARMPNYEFSDPDNVLDEWWRWENPKWWVETEHKTNLNGGARHLGIDTKNLTGTAEDYVGGLVWSEWGVVMGCPYATKIEAFDPKQKAIVFQGPWQNDSYIIHRNCRYKLEDKPNFLDEAGEYWFDKQNGGGRLYVRLPGDVDPSGTTIEAGKRINLVDATQMDHVHISGLTFRFNNLYWNIDDQAWRHPDVDNAAIRLVGAGTDIGVRNCVFEHVSKAIRLRAATEPGLDDILIADNQVHYTDHGAITVREGSQDQGQVLLDVRVLRNDLYHIGFRPMRVNGHHALTVAFPETAEIAGNILHRCGGAGLFLFGGKGSGRRYEVPFFRMLVHHNKVTDPLLIANDWGGIETWQGGPFYVYNNVSGNPGGLMHWTAGRKGKGTPRFGFAYYLDGAFKNYLFNNIAWGKNNTLGSVYANCSAFQEIISYQNTFFNNTAYKFVVASRRQAPQAGRDKFLGIIFDNISEQVFRHSDKEGVDPNARDAGEQVDQFAYETSAYADNIFYDVTNRIGVFEAEGGDYTNVADFAAALEAKNAMASSVGIVASEPPMRDPQLNDFRLTFDSAAIDSGVQVFVPWSLYAVVGEWNFTRNNADPTIVIDEHWYMTDYHIGRGDYYTRPTYPLTAVGISEDNYVDGPLENWTKGALGLNGRDQYLTLSQETLTTPFTYETKGTKKGSGWLTVNAPEKVAVGQKFTVGLTVSEPDPNQKICAHLHWRRAESWGDFNAWGGHPQTLDTKGPHEFTFTPEDKEGLDSFSLLIFISPSGELGDATRQVSVAIGKADEASELKIKDTVLGGEDGTINVVVEGKDLKNPRVYDSSFLIEAYLKTEPGQTNGTVFAKINDDAGYALTLNNAGGVTLEVKSGAGSAQLKDGTAINDGEWHHVIAEVDRPNGTLAVYVDGRQTSVLELKLPADLSFENTADLVACKDIACQVEFLRIALGTLADAKTSIEELYAWQFNGPQYRDFAGRKPQGRRDAGALEWYEE